jgi:hypothetical protein
LTAAAVLTIPFDGMSAACPANLPLAHADRKRFGLSLLAFPIIPFLSFQNALLWRLLAPLSGMLGQRRQLKAAVKESGEQ